MFGRDPEVYKSIPSLNALCRAANVVEKSVSEQISSHQPVIVGKRIASVTAMRPTYGVLSVRGKVDIKEENSHLKHKVADASGTVDLWPACKTRDAVHEENAALDHHVAEKCADDRVQLREVQTANAHQMHADMIWRERCRGEKCTI